MLPDYRVRQRDYLLEISRALTSRLTLSEVLQLISQLSTQILNGQAALITLIDPDGRLRIHTSYGIAQPLLDKLTPLLEREADPKQAEQTLRQNLAAIAEQAEFGLWQVVSLPLKNGEESLGVLYVYRMRGGEFSSNDRVVLQSFADQAAIAVSNARLYDQLTYESRRLNALFEFSADGIIIMDPSHRISTFNQKLSAMLEIGSANAIGRRFEEVIVLSHVRAGMLLEDAEAQGWPLGTAAPLFVECDARRTDGQTVPVEINFAPLFDSQRRLVNIMANVHDLTRLRQADEMKNTFISAVSHELKTPVALIKGYASTMRRPDVQWDAATLNDSLTVIEEESDRLAELIDNLLDASRAQAGNFKIAPVELDIDALVQRVMNKLRPQTRTHTLIADVPDDLPLVFADELRITQVLNNLLTNAIKYSAGGEIRVSAEIAPGAVTISVHDQGPGIAPHDRPHLFERFYRSETASKKSIPGTGLGLYLSRSIIKAHGGNIWLAHTDAQGSTFSFSLPRSLQLPGPADNTRSAPAAQVDA
jgi:PAS domain S-box-containing protein